MSTAYIVVTILAAAWVGYSAVAVLTHAKWVVSALSDYGVPRSWWPWLGAAKTAGAVGLLVGLFVPLIGVVAEVALVLYFAGAVVTVIRAHWYAHIPYPLVYVAPVIAAMALRIAA
ncbi:MAG: DoxX family protein [Candidatus Dormiibacterota bacterium]